MEAFTDLLHRKIGVSNIPLEYVTREFVHVPLVATNLVNHQPHSDKHGLVEGNLVPRVWNNHSLFHKDNYLIYYHLEEET